MRYIDADKQIERYSKKLGFYIDEEGEDRFSAKCEEIRAAISALYNAPTADVVEVVHGCWLSVDEYGQKISIDTEGYLNNWVFCSNCEQQMRFAGWPYCPNCGAKMGGKKVE